MASSQTSENLAQNKACNCGDGEKIIWTSRASDGSEQSNSFPNCEILKSGPLLVSSKGIGWTSWKRRWFVLSRSSLIFYRNDPNVLPQKGSEANATLGGIDLNNSGSVVVKADKKLLTVLFPDGRDGRTFTLKAETLEELNEWKTALENALAQAPSAAHVMGQKGIFHNEVALSVEASDEQSKDKPLTTSLVVSTPVLLTLDSIDGSPSFLEKALRFIEDHGIKVEGILRQSADVEEVEHRVQEYEQGKSEFSSDEDAHVIGDCIKHVLREMPSSPVPASCCTALVDAYRSDRESRIDAMRDAIFETFPEPNRRLLQRILQMMLTVAAHRAENRMSLSALAACMAPLLLRPLLAGECELKNDFKMDGDGSFQLLQAAAAANHAQAIVIILLEEYEKIFDDGLLEEESLTSELYTESEDEEDIEDEESTDNDIPEDGGYQDAEDNLKANTGDDLDRSYSGTPSESGSDVGSEDGTDLGSDVGSEVGSSIGSDVGSDIRSDEGSDIRSDDGSIADNDDGTDVDSDADPEAGSNLSGYQDDKDRSTAFLSAQRKLAVENTTTYSNRGSKCLHHDIDQKPLTSTDVQSTIDVPFSITSRVQKDGIQNENSIFAVPLCRELCKSTGDAPSSTVLNKAVNTIPCGSKKFTDKSIEPQPIIMRNKWGRTSARKNLSMESIEYISDDESTIQRLESMKSALQTKITDEIEGNAVFLESLNKRKEASRERRLALEIEVARLQEQLQKQRDLRSHLESGMMNMQTGQLSTLACLDSKTRSHLEEIILTERDIIYLEENIADLCGQLQQVHATLCQSCGQPVYKRNEQQKSVDSILPAQKGESSSKNENPTIESYSADLRMRSQDLPSSENKQLSHDIKMSLQSSGLFPGDTTSRVENPMTITENSENLKAEAKNSSGDRQTFHKLLPKLTYQSSGSRSSGTTPASSAEARRSSSKKAAQGDSMKRDALDSPSARRLSSHKKQLSNSCITSERSTETSTSLCSEEHTALMRNNATRRHFPKSEEVASSSALAKLTNRLNFLKERRVQLANELQNLDIGQAPRPKAQPKTNSR